MLQGVAVALLIPAVALRGPCGCRTTVMISHSVLMTTSTSHSPTAPRHKTQARGPLFRLTRMFSLTHCIRRQAKQPPNSTPKRNLREAQVEKSFPTMKAKVRQKSPPVQTRKQAWRATELLRRLSCVKGMLASSEMKSTKEKTMPAAAKASSTMPHTALVSHRL